MKVEEALLDEAEAAVAAAVIRADYFCLQLTLSRFVAYPQALSVQHAGRLVPVTRCSAKTSQRRVGRQGVIGVRQHKCFWLRLLLLIRRMH